MISPAMFYPFICAMQPQSSPIARGEAALRLLAGVVDGHG